MKKIFGIAALGAATLSLASCGETYEIALITDIGSIDDKSFNQGSYEGVKKYANETGKTYTYYQPASNGKEDLLDQMELAVKGGAEVIVTPGFTFEEAVHTFATDNPEIEIILIDAMPNSGNYTYENLDNVASVFYAEDEAGFLAGYAAIQSGFRKLGFYGGMPMPAVTKFGNGFIAGAHAAANDLGLENDVVQIRFDHFDAFEPNANFVSSSKGWYQGGTEVIFAAAGGAGNSVMKAAEEVGNKYVIGVDVDQSSESNTVITSATKALTTAVYEILVDYYENDQNPAESDYFGHDTLYTAAENGVGLVDPSTSGAPHTALVTWYNASYTTLFDKVANKEYADAYGLGGEAIQLEAYASGWNESTYNSGITVKVTYEYTASAA